MPHAPRHDLDDWLFLDDPEEEESGAPLPANALQLLTFHLGGELYGIDLLKVRELIPNTPFTPVPNLPPHVKGVINLRGLVVPVVDLGQRFGLGETPLGKYTVIIVAETSARLTGLVVEAVADVVTLTRDTVQPPPAACNHEMALDMAFLQGVAPTRVGMVILIDPERLLARETLMQGEGA